GARLTHDVPAGHGPHGPVPGGVRFPDERTTTVREARLVPRAAVPYLVVPDHNHHAGLAHLRREALDVLAAGYRSARRTLLGVLAWVLAVGGATLLASLPWVGGPTVRTAALAGLGAALLGGGLWLAAGVLRSGRRITAAAAQ